MPASMSWKKNLPKNHKTDFNPSRLHFVQTNKGWVTTPPLASSFSYLKNKVREVKIFTPQLHLLMKPAEEVGPPEIGDLTPADICQEHRLNKALDSSSGSP